MTSCRDLDSRSLPARLWHRLWCAKCRAARRADALLDRGVLALKSAPPPPDLLSLTMATVGVRPSARRPRRNRWIAALRRFRLPAGTATLLLACGWFHYMDLDPQIRISAPPLPSPNAYDLFVQAAKIEDPPGLGDFNADVPAAPSGFVTILWKGQVSFYQGDLHHLPRGAHLVTEREKRLIKEQNYRQLLRRNKQLLQKSAGKITLLRNALKFACAPYTVGAFGTPSIPPNFQKIADPLITEGDVRVADGDLYGALNSYCDALQIGVETENGSMEERGTSRLWTLVDRLNVAQARSAVQRMERILKLHLPLASRLQQREQLALADLMQRFHDPHWRISLRTEFRESYYKTKTQPDEWSPEDMVAYIQTLPYSKRWITHCYIDLMNRAIEDAKRPYCLRQMSNTSNDVRRQYFLAIPPQADFGNLWESVAESYNGPDYNGTYSETEEVLLLVSLALRVYRKEHGFYPADLNALIPETLSALPADPFNGQPLHYRAVGAKYILYTVGPDGTEDYNNGINQMLPKASDQLH